MLKLSYHAEKGSSFSTIITRMMTKLISREELEKQKSAAAYQRLHQAGKTDEARRDLARLALIRQQREESARKGRKTAKIHTGIIIT